MVREIGHWRDSPSVHRVSWLVVSLGEEKKDVGCQPGTEEDYDDEERHRCGHLLCSQCGVSEDRLTRGSQ